MHLRYRFALPLVALSLALAFSPALAARPTPVPIPGIELPNQITGTGGLCLLGQNGVANAAVWFFPSDDYYYTFFDPAQCGCAGGITDHVANWSLFWQTQCAIVVQAWIVKAVETTPGCYVPAAGTDPPDPTAAEILCGPSAPTTISGAGLTTHSIALPPCACINEKAFVLFKIVNNVNCPVDQGALTSPGIVYDASPDLCTSYNGFLGGAPADMVPSFGFTGNTTMWVEANCCQPTPTLPGTWGHVKTLYR